MAARRSAAGGCERKYSSRALSGRFTSSAIGEPGCCTYCDSRFSNRFTESIKRVREAVTDDSNNLRAWRGLEDVSWRAGDVDDTLEAATEAVRRGETEHDWELLARAWSVASPADAVKGMADCVNEIGDPTRNRGPAANASHIELAGLEFFFANASALADFKSALEIIPTPPEQSYARREMAWWMYRAGNLPAAADQLEQAHQEFPGFPETLLLLAWVMSDLGRQADAETSLHHPTDPKHSAEYVAAQAVIRLRTGDTQGAKLLFQQAAHDDAAWMVLRWVQNNYSASAAGVIRQLQALESARRLKEMQERLRAAAAPAAKQTQPQE